MKIEITLPENPTAISSSDGLVLMSALQSISKIKDVKIVCTLGGMNISMASLATWDISNSLIPEDKK